MTDDLTTKVCIACEGGIPPLTREQAEGYMDHVAGWQIDADTKQLIRTFTFKNFADALAFVNKVGALAEAEGHHPDIELSWGRVSINLTTHALGGLSENDFILAAKINLLHNTESVL